MTKLFGTNGIRGVANEDMNCELALGIGKAWGTYFRKTIARPIIAIGTDARLSNHMLKCAVTAGFMTTWRDFILNQSYNNNWMSCIPILPRFMDFPDIIGMRVPLPTLVFATRQDPLYNILEVERASKILEKIYRKAKRTDAFRFSFYKGFHKFDLSMQEEAWSWLDQWLAK